MAPSLNCTISDQYNCQEMHQVKTADACTKVVQHHGLHLEKGTDMVLHSGKRRATCFLPCRALYHLGRAAQVLRAQKSSNRQLCVNSRSRAAAASAAAQGCG
jgi:hypothetical protein